MLPGQKYGEFCEHTSKVYKNTIFKIIPCFELFWPNLLTFWISESIITRAQWEFSPAPLSAYHSLDQRTKGSAVEGRMELLDWETGASRRGEKVIGLLGRTDQDPWENSIISPSLLQWTYLQSVYLLYAYSNEGSNPYNSVPRGNTSPLSSSRPREKCWWQNVVEKKKH